MKAKVTIDGKEHEITLTEEQIRQTKENWRDEYCSLLKSMKTVETIAVSFASSMKSEVNYVFPVSGIVSKSYDKIGLLARMTQFALLRNGDWVAEWNNINQLKYGIVRINPSSIITDSCVIENSSTITGCRDYNQFVFGIAVKTMEIAKEMLGIFEEDIIKYYK